MKKWHGTAKLTATTGCGFSKGEPDLRVSRIMNVKVTLYFGLRDLLGEKENGIELQSGATIRELLRFLCDSDERRHSLYDDDYGALNPLITILRNGRFGGQLDTSLKDGDWIDIFPGLGGG